jgi:hypothetical protein
MTFSSWQSRGDEDTIQIPAIGLDLRVRLPNRVSSGALEMIETINAPGFGPPLHRHPETEMKRECSTFSFDSRAGCADLAVGR